MERSDWLVLEKDQLLEGSDGVDLVCKPGNIFTAACPGVRNSSKIIHGVPCVIDLRSTPRFAEDKNFSPFFPQEF